jgi:predicted enzyme related to lactoylglutathione lyase
MTLTLYAVAIDCHDASTLAQFWAAALGRNVDDGATAEFASIGLQDPAHNRPQWMFNQVPESKKAKNRVHVDLLSPNLDEEVERLISLGATRVNDFKESGATWTTLSDPEGNEFDVVADTA